MRKIIVYIATSADGYIARPDGDVGWPQPGTLWAWCLVALQRLLANFSRRSAQRAA